MHAPGRGQRWVLLLVILLAAALRFPDLNSQSFWNDEGNTARLIERTVPLILEGAAGDVHPPGYYLVLRLWRAAVGESEFALRSYAAFCTILMVAITARLGRRLGGGVTAAAASLLVAVHPLAVTYGQEARMYAQLGLVTALTMWASMALVGTWGQRRSSVGAKGVLGLALCIAAGLYTQYTYALVLISLTVAFGLWWLTARPYRWRLLLLWALAHLLGGLLFLPWAPVALRATGWRPPDLSQVGALTALVRTLLVGTTLPDAPLQLLLPPIGGLALTTVALSIRMKQRRLGRWIALAVALLPAGIIWATGIYRPAYLKFLMMSIPAVALALSTGLCADRRLRDGSRQGEVSWRQVSVAALLLGGVLPYQIRSLIELKTNPACIRDDYRGIAASIRAQAREGDAILLSAPNQWEVFTYYYGREPVDALPVYPAPYRPMPSEARAWVADIVDRHQGGRLTVLFWGDGESDPDRLIERALATQTYKAGEEWVTTVRVARYGIGPTSPAPELTVGAQLGDAIALVGSSLPDTTWRPGDILPLALFWKAQTAPEDRLKVFVHLVNAVGELVAQTDGEPVSGLAPTTIWQPGTHIEDRYGMALPADLPAGDYTLLIGMYRFSGERLPITQDGAAIGDALPLYAIDVVTED